jgi:curved DNA-binding protein CbpA
VASLARLTTSGRASTEGTLPAPDQRVPELNGGVDIRALPLTAIDGFVLSRIDGHSSLADIIAMTGLAPEQVHGILTKLAELGAIRLPEAAPANGRATPPRAQGTQPLAASSSAASPSAAAERRGSSEPPRTPTGTSLPPVSPSTLPRRRPSYGSTPRRLFSESSISGAPPDMRSIPPRASQSTPPRPRTPVPASFAPDADRTRDTASQPVSGRPSPPPSRAPLAFDSSPPTNQLPLLNGARDTRDSDAATTGPRAPLISILPSREPLPSRPAVLYDPRELEEEVDLPPDRRKQVLDTFYRLPVLSYYGVLGVPESAEKKQIRAAYFALSKAFHPDSMFRKELGSFKAKMTTVFQALTEAYETLSKPKARDEYDRYLRSTRSVRDAERALATEEVAAADVNVEVPLPPPLPSTDYVLPTPTPMPAPPREVSADARRIARELLERRLRGGAPRPTPPEGAAAGKASSLPSQSSSVPSLPPSSSSSPIDRQALARQLGRTLIDIGKLTGSADKLTQAVNGARVAFERGDIAASVQHMARAFSLAPDRADLHAEYDRLQGMLAQKLANDYEEQARFEVKSAKFAAAAVSWAKVCEGRPTDAVAHRSTAFALLKAGGDLRSAQKYAQQAVYLAPDDIDGRILLAQTYLTVGLKLNARRELDAAAKLDPTNEMVKNLLSDLKG